MGNEPDSSLLTLDPGPNLNVASTCIRPYLLMGWVFSAPSAGRRSDNRHRRRVVDRAAILSRLECLSCIWACISLGATSEQRGLPCLVLKGQHWPASCGTLTGRQSTDRQF